MFFNHNFTVSSFLKPVDVNAVVSEYNYGENSANFEMFSSQLENALAEKTPYYQILPNAEKMHPINLFALDTVIKSARSNLRILTTSIPERAENGLDFFGHEGITSSLIAAAKTGVKIDIILRQPEKFTYKHKLYSLASSEFVTFYDAMDEELRDCKCRYAIADNTISKFRFEVDANSDSHDEVEIIANTTSEDIQNLVDNFELLIGDSRFTKIRKFS